MHLVKCKYCGETFDRDKEPTIQVSARRYAHKKCAEEHENNKTQEEKDIEALERYIMKLFDEPYVNARIKKQIKEFQADYNYTYSGILKTLVYWYDIKGNSTDKANGGIGIVPYVYEQAYNYFYNLYLAQLSNEDKDIEQYKPKEKVIVIPPPFVQRRKPKLFFEEDEEEKI